MLEVQRYGNSGCSIGRAITAEQLVIRFVVTAEIVLSFDQEIAFVVEITTDCADGAYY